MYDWLSDLYKQREVEIFESLKQISEVERIYFSRVSEVFSEFLTSVGFPEKSFSIEVVVHYSFDVQQFWLHAFERSTKITAPINLLDKSLRGVHNNIPFLTKKREYVESMTLTEGGQPLQYIQVYSEKSGCFVTINRHPYGVIDIYEVMTCKK